MLVKRCHLFIFVLATYCSHYMLDFFKFIKEVLTMFRSNFTAMSFCLIIIYTLIIAGDVELNPGPGETPVNFEDHCLSIFHDNIRNLRNKVEYISNIIENYDIVSFYRDTS